MSHPTTRILAALELLQTRGRISGAELAQSLEVDRRTVRRYIALLEEIGVPITAEVGRHGGYELISGYKLPPMMFSNDEALALALGLVAARGLGLADGTQAVASARAKLERVMPEKIKARVRAVEATVSLGNPRVVQSQSQEINATLAELSAAADARHGVRLAYRSASGAGSERDFDPYGLAHRGGHWYVVGHCHARRGMRSFRLDRVASVTAQPRKFKRPDGFDVFEHLDRSIAALPRKFAIEVLLATDLQSAGEAIFPALGVLETCLDGVLLRSQADDLQWFARELARLPWPFTIRTPTELRKELAANARAMLRQTAR